MSKKMASFLFSLSLASIVWTGIAAGFLGYCVFRAGYVQKAALLYIPKGAGLKAIALEAQKEGANPYPALFIMAARLSGLGRELKAGEYQIAENLSLYKLLEHLAYGATLQRYVTIPEGGTRFDLARLLANLAPYTEPFEGSLPPEGAILPETYAYMRGESQHLIVRRMEKAMDDMLAEEWRKRAPDLGIKDAYEAVILASIVEKETALASERPLIAAVFHNRLKKNMRLQSDPTVIFGLTAGLPLGRGLTKSELKHASLFNTYVQNGLPPSPIANVGRAALQAVLHPASVDYLYFVADGSGGHAFASDLKQHQKNVQQWRALERRGQAADDSPSEGDTASAQNEKVAQEQAPKQ